MRKLSDFLMTEILYNKGCNKPNKHYIQSIQQLYDKGEMTKLDFINTGRFMPIKDYFENYGYHPHFHKEAKDLMRYAGGYCIQVLPNGEWLFDGNDATESDEVNTKFKSKNLSVVEDFMWKHYIKKKIE